MSLYTGFSKKYIYFLSRYFTVSRLILRHRAYCSFPHLSSSFLGESIPVTKTQLPQADNLKPWKMHCAEDYKKHILFCGTEVIQTKGDDRGVVKAVVLQTGQSAHQFAFPFVLFLIAT